MNQRCISADELARLLDGEATESRAAYLRTHAATCARCAAAMARHQDLLADISAPAASAEAAHLVAKVMRRLDGAAVPPLAPARWDWRWVWGGAVGTALAVATFVLFVTARPTGSTHEDLQGTWQARGSGTQPERLDRKVGTTLYTLDPSAGRRALGADATVGQHTPLLLSYRNLFKDPVYLLAFAIDAKHDIHWLYPAYLSANEDPAAVKLPPGPGEVAMAESVVLDRPAPGVLRVITIISRTQDRVSSIERLAPVDLQLASLQSRWPNAAIKELPLNLVEIK